MWIHIRCKNTKFIAIRCVFQVPVAPRPVFGWGSAPGPLWGAYDASQIPIRLGSSLKEAEARQTCPGFFLKSLLESPGNLLD